MGVTGGREPRHVGGSKDPPQKHAEHEEVQTGLFLVGLYGILPQGFASGGLHRILLLTTAT